MSMARGTPTGEEPAISRAYIVSVVCSNAWYPMIAAET